MKTEDKEELKAKAIADLNALDDADPESAHSRADAILSNYVRAIGEVAIADAFEAARERVGFWYA